MHNDLESGRTESWLLAEAHPLLLPPGLSCSVRAVSSTHTHICTFGQHSLPRAPLLAYGYKHQQYSLPSPSQRWVKGGNPDRPWKWAEGCLDQELQDPRYLRHGPGKGVWAPGGTFPAV